MKKIGKLQKYGFAVAAVLISIALMFTCIAFVNPFTAKAAGERSTTPDEISLIKNVSVPKECDYGETFTVPAGESGTTVSVKAPNGQEVATAAGDVKANQMGNYTVTYTKDGASVDYFVYVSLQEEFFLRVDNNGADIPTFIKKGESFTLPNAKVAYYDEDDVLKFYPAESTTLTIKDSLNNPAYSAGDSVVASKNGKLYITYNATIGGAEGTKNFSKVFTVNVQASLTDDAAPTLSVAGVTTDISINRPVTLPKATATDSYDENVKIEIKVVGPDGNNVKTVSVDRYGYGYRKQGEEYTDVEFDNDRSMKFYPTAVGDYVVTYVATDDAGNKSATREYHMTCKDLAAPVFEDVDDWQWRIPETWGLTVKKAGEGDETVTVPGAGGIINFPIPTVVDNKDNAYPTHDGDTDLISMYFRVTDSDNSRTIVEFTNILAPNDSDDCKFPGNSVYGTAGTTYTFNKDTNNGLFPFNFGEYHRLDSKGESTSLPGTYTVYYRARDKAQNTSSKTFTVTLEETYTDSAAPSAAEVSVPSYVSEADETFDIPSPSVSDGKDSRPQVEYRIYSAENGLTGAGQYIDVKGGEKAEFERRESDLYLVVDKDATDRYGVSYEKALKIASTGDTLYFYVSVTDKVGNVKRNTSDNSEDFTKCEDSVKVVSSSAASNYQYNGSIAFSVEGSTAADIYAGDNVIAGGFKVETNRAMRHYTGFEVAVRDPKGNPLNVTLDTTSTVPDASATDSSTLFVKNISFKPSVEGVHTLTVKVFDVNGKNDVYAYTLDVKPSQSSGTQTTAATIGTTGSVNVKYKLHNEVMTDVGSSASGDLYFVARRISGGVFSLMGSELTAKTVGSYSVTDGYIASSAISSGDIADFDAAFKPYGGNDATYTVNITSSDTPVIEVQGAMPTYAAKDAYVEIPSIIAYTENGNADVEIVVTDAKANEVDLEDINEAGKYNMKKFKGTTDGAYTVTVTATFENGSPATATYTVNVGDVIGPEFTVSGGTTGRNTVGNKFSFSTMTLAEGESATGVTITKKLIDPSREEVADATVSGSFSSYAASADNGTEIDFSMAGSYEVVYTATDSVGNVTTQRYTITVVSSGSGTPTTITTLSTVLIIVAVVLLAGVIVYVVRFRKVKEKK